MTSQEIIQKTKQESKQESKQKSNILSEFKVVPLKSDELCLLDPFLLIIIVIVIGVLIYYLGVKYAEEIHSIEPNKDII